MTDQNERAAQAENGVVLKMETMPKRLVSLDALRGFDMFFIMGGAGLIVALCTALGFKGCWLAQQMSHVSWEGLRHHDTIFPLFLFIAGVAWPFSYAKQVERGFSKGRIALRCLRRGLILFVLGLYCGRLLSFDFAHVRFWSVLGRIGLAWMISAWIYMLVPKTRVRIGIAALILVGAWLFFRFVPAPDAATFTLAPEHAKAWWKGLLKLGNGPFTPVGDWGCWIDRTFFGAHSYTPLYDPEGASGFFPAIVTAMLGVFAGEWLRREDVTGNRKTLVLLGAGALCGLLAWPLQYSCPIVKALWSPSFVLAVGCYSFVMMALFYWLIDVRGWKTWAFFFQVIGMNAITIYLGQGLFSLGHCRDALFGGLVKTIGGAWGGVLNSVTYIAVCWCLLYFLYRKKAFLRV